MPTATADPATEQVETRPHPTTGVPETQPAREARLLADTSDVTMEDVAAMGGLTVGYVRELHAEAKAGRLILEGQMPLRAKPRSKRIVGFRDATPEEVAAAAARRDEWMPLSTRREAETGAWVWPACEIWRWLRLRHVNEWYEPHRDWHSRRPGLAGQPGPRAGS